jgi:hypothetical protein
MSQDRPVFVIMTGLLHLYRSERQLPSRVRVEVPADGVTAREIAVALDLPVERIEGLFLNHTCADLDAMVVPGDRVAFVPYGTPASHPAFFGRFDKARGR